MISADRGAWECDLAETYGIFDYTALPASKLAALSAGLRDDSRIKMVLGGEKLSLTQTLLAGVVDRLGVLIWQLSGGKDGGKSPPTSILELLSGGAPDRNETKDIQIFQSPVAFEQAWAEMTGVRHGN